MMNIQDLKISFDELKMLLATSCNLMMAIYHQKSTAEITNCINLYESMLENESISEAIKIFHNCFNDENEKDHEKNRVEVREKMKTYISQNEAQKLDEIIESANTWFKIETGMYSKVGGYAGFYLSRCWNETTQKNKSDPILFSKLSKFDLKGGMKSEQLLFGLCYTAAFHLITVNNLILIKKLIK